MSKMGLFTLIEETKKKKKTHTGLNFRAQEWDKDSTLG